MLKSSQKTTKKEAKRAKPNKPRTTSNSKADGSKLPKAHLSSSNPKMRTNRRSLRFRASVTPATPTMPLRWQSNGRNTNGPVKKNLINEY